jgi:membrane fusion protein, multidrug efflux system
VQIRSAIITLLLLTGCQSAPQAGPGGGMVFPPVPVSVGRVVQENVPIEVRAVGNVEPYSSVQIKAQVGGPLLSVRFTEGANVRKGDLLFEIDPRPFREALRQAEAAVMKDQAQLRVAEANLARSRAQLKNAQAEAGRYEQLSKEGISTRMQEDQIRTAAEVAEQTLRSDEASIEGIRAALESDQAAVEQAKLNLSYCEIRSPISGRAGNVLVHPGNLVKANDENPLVVINQIAPIFVTFGVPERYLGTITRQQGRGRLAVDITFERNSGDTLRGNLSVIDNTVDRNTGTIRLKAVFDNRQNQLWPGQFVNAVLTMDTQMATLVPSEAVQAGQQGSFVYVVKPDQSVEARPVTIGQNVEGRVIVEQGLAAGETIVTDGQSRLFPGAKVITATPSSQSN